MSTHKINRVCLILAATITTIALYDCQLAIAQPPPRVSVAPSDVVLMLEGAQPLGLSEMITVFTGKPGVPKRRAGGGTR